MWCQLTPSMLEMWKCHWRYGAFHNLRSHMWDPPFFFPSSLALHFPFLGWRGSNTGSYTSWRNTLTPNSIHTDESFPIHQGLMVPATLRTCYFLTDWKPASATIHQHQLWSLIHVVEFGKSIKKKKGDKWESQQTYLWKKKKRSKWIILGSATQLKCSCMSLRHVP